MKYLRAAPALFITALGICLSWTAVQLDWNYLSDQNLRQLECAEIESGLYLTASELVRFGALPWIGIFFITGLNHGHKQEWTYARYALFGVFGSLLCIGITFLGPDLKDVTDTATYRWLCI